MPWPEIRLSSWDHFVAVVSHLEYGPIATFPYLYRGQSQSIWTLEPSLIRELPRTIAESEAEQIEEDCRRLFAERVHLHIPAEGVPKANEQLDWWALMQHHGSPSRLLDWTSSIYVAAYFSVVDDWDSDGAIWLFHPKTLIDQLIGDLSLLSRAKTIFGRLTGHPSEFESFALFRPAKPSHRMVVQQGYFLYHRKLLVNIADTIDIRLAGVHASGGEEVYRKIVIPRELKPLILRHLRVMNITAAALFSGVDGLGFSVRELARLSGVYPRSSGSAS